MWNSTLERSICKIDVLGGGIISQVQDRVLSQVSSTCLKMETLENLVSILCMKPKFANKKMAKSGFLLHALEIFSISGSKWVFEGKCGF